MKVELVEIADRGVLDKERVRLRVLEDANMTNYAIFDSRYSSPSSIQNGQKACYWCPPTMVKAGANVVIYTRAGNPNTETAPDGTISHFMFRNQPSPLYSDPASCAVLFEILHWQTSKQPPAT